jgi:3',5'-cyclic AMP phosphodiesterase CpdA
MSLESRGLKVAVSRIWDLRRGDNDDNRMSPHGRGLRKVVLSAVLEFNFLHASIIFFTLIILPALLVGIAPSLFYTYGRLSFRAASSAGNGRLTGLIWLAVLVVIAYWLGRPLLRIAFDNFKQLSYTVVFPMFVTLRETMRTVAERFSRSAVTAEQLDRGRRWGTILATLIIVSGGLTLALTTEIHRGVQVLDIERSQPWALAKAALINAALFLAFSSVVESLYWLWRELKVGGPVRDWGPTPQKAGVVSAIRIAHLSDLHLVGERYGFRMEAGRLGPRGNQSIRVALRKLNAINRSNPLERILIAGDITDAGMRAEWTEFIDLLRGCTALKERMSFVPGNHDVNIVDRTNPGRLELPWSPSQSLRKLRVVLALDAIQGDRSHIVNRNTGELGPLLSEYLREGNRMDLLRSLAERGTIRGRWEMNRVWDSIFPLVEPARDKNGWGVILLDSNANSHIALTNAIGFVNPPQLRALKSLLKQFPDNPWILVLHHQVVEYPGASISLIDRASLALVNASDVLAVITPYSSHVLVLHGHRHRDWIGKCGFLVLCSAPSTSLGSQLEKYKGSFLIHELTLDQNRNIQLTKSDHVKVA